MKRIFIKIIIYSIICAIIPANNIFAGISKAQNSLTIFIDRFGDTYINGKCRNIELFLQSNNIRNRKINEIRILHAPFTSEFDKKRTLKLLKSHFPKAKFKIETAKRKDFPKLILQKNDTQLISQVLANRNRILQMIAEKHHNVFAYCQNYIIKLRKQISKISNKISVWNKEYNTITQHKNKKDKSQ